MASFFAVVYQNVARNLVVRSVQMKTLRSRLFAVKISLYGLEAGSNRAAQKLPRDSVWWQLDSWEEDRDAAFTDMQESLAILRLASGGNGRTIGFVLTD
jgi:hypothetical protein